MKIEKIKYFDFPISNAAIIDIWDDKYMGTLKFDDIFSAKYMI